MLKSVSMVAASTLGILASSWSFAADQIDADRYAGSNCAVSGINGKIEAAGGKIDSGSNNGSRQHIAGSFSTPLGCQFGLQLDGNVGTLDGFSTSGFAGHLFYRDPSSYLLGFYGSFNKIGENDLHRIAIEGELYLQQFTFSGIIGSEDSDNTNSDMFGAGKISFYLSDNLEINGGVAQFLDVNVATAGIEWQLEGSNISLFADAAFGDNNHNSVFGGLRYYFGKQKTLIRRHREDDPENWTAPMESITQETDPVTTELPSET